MRNPALDKLERDWPKRHALRAEEVAEVLGKEPTKGVVQEIRRRMKTGRYPGARKIDGSWQLPLPDLAAILSPPPDPKQAPGKVMVKPPTQAKPVQRRRAILGPTISFIRAARFWARVLTLLGEQDLARELTEEAEQRRLASKDAYAAQKAERQKAALDEELRQILDAKPETSSKRGPLGRGVKRAD